MTYRITRTTYASGFSRTEFRQLELGDPVEKVLEVLGNPIYQCDEALPTLRFSYPTLGIFITAKGRTILHIEDTDGLSDPFSATSLDWYALQEILGPASAVDRLSHLEYWAYSQSAKSGHFWKAVVVVDKAAGNVVAKDDGLYFD